MYSKFIKRSNCNFFFHFNSCTAFDVRVSSSKLRYTTYAFGKTIHWKAMILISDMISELKIKFLGIEDILF